MNRFFLFVLTLLAFASCQHSHQRNRQMAYSPGPLQTAYESTHGRSQPLTPADLACSDLPRHSSITEIAIERTACYGFCPIYTLIMRSDGTAEYQGYANVKKIGRHVGKIEPALFQQVASVVYDIGFFEFGDRYTCPITDNPTVYVSAVRQGERKIIEHYAPAQTGPPRLALLEAWIDHVGESIDWK